jgi:hypothetical protein
MPAEAIMAVPHINPFVGVKPLVESGIHFRTSQLIVGFLSV